MAVILVFLTIAIAALLIKSSRHRRHAKRAGDPTGSLWYHVQQSYREEQEKRMRGKEEQEQHRIVVANARQTARIPHLAATVSSTPSSEKYSRKHRNKIARDNAREAKKVAPQPLDEIRFIYHDQHNQQSQRQVSVVAVDEQYFEGRCHTRHATRTFITRRIVGEIISLQTGEVSKPGTWARQLRRHRNNREIRFESQSKPLAGSTGSRGNDWETAVYFAGFRSEHRGKLEALAEDANWQVRAGFSESLDIMVAGTLVGKVQMAQAEATAVEIITEQEFRERMYTNT